MTELKAERCFSCTIRLEIVLTPAAAARMRSRVAVNARDSSGLVGGSFVVAGLAITVSVPQVFFGPGKITAEKKVTRLNCRKLSGWSYGD